MPTHTGKDTKGCYAQWGKSGKKYYYTCGNAKARKQAIAKANAQGAAAHASGYTGNSKMKKIHTFVTTNVKPVVRNDSMEGKDWLVVPTQMITEGVHSGSDGPIFYPAEELAKLPVVWNHKPVVVYHPTENGRSVSACDPVQLTARKVGVMMNTEWNKDTSKLGTECWLDPVRVNMVDERIAETIDNNEMMEVSTGLYTELDPCEGVWNGESYSVVARNLQPDHLALLPDVKGACSIEDGAGFLRVNEASDGIDIKIVEDGEDVTKNYLQILSETVASFDPDSFDRICISGNKGISAVVGTLKEKKTTAIQTCLFDKAKWNEEGAKEWVSNSKKSPSVNALILNELSFDDKESLIRSALYEQKDNAWLERTYDSYFIYEEGGTLYKQDYTMSDSSVSFVGLPKQVEKQVNYVEIPIIMSNLKKGDKMEKEKLVDALIGNEKTSWTEDHRETLMGLEDDILTNMHTDMVELSKPIVNEDDKKDGQTDKKGEPEVKANDAEPKSETVEEFVSKAPDEIKEVLNDGLATLEDERERLTKTIKANKKNKFTDEQLKDMKINMLRSLAALATDDETPEGNVIPMYDGQVDVRPTGNAVPDPLPLPKMDFGQTKTG